ncbi:uncharacterized protein LOC114307944 [Camellia sinensis]|uniref:uncharacterized protein LOC114307944 n=1 Tax=Camellia sinensis TaxID=4442 RepID=UPI0010368ACC|nr:uncharacterized protein LOC114307944 [Camellia sinensis]
MGGNYGVVECTEDGGNDQDDIQNIGRDDHRDLLPTYCPNTGKMFLSAQWAYEITHVGQCFDGGPNEFCEVLCKYAVERGFQFKYIKNDSVRIIAVYKFVEAIGCKWNLRTGSDLVSNIIADWVRDQPLTRPTDVVFNLRNEYGLEISYQVAWLGVEKVRGEVYGDHAMSFNQLRWYNDSVMKKNPNSYFNLDFEQNIGRFKGNLLAAIVKDGNQGLFPVAFVVVDSENAANWEWFLQNLKQVIGGDRTLTFISDRHAGLLQSMLNIFPSAHHAYCLLHLQMNLRDHLKYVNATHKIGLMRKLRECGYASIVDCFIEKMDVLKKCSPAVIEGFMKDLDPKHLANAYFRGQRYGEMCSNATESFNNWVSGACHLPITRLVDMIRVQIMEQMVGRRVKSMTWLGILCPKMEKKLVAAYNDSRPWCVSQANDDVYEVHSHPSVLVDMATRKCSCFQWQINRFPCSHAIVAFRNSGRNIYDSLDRAFHIEMYWSSYSGMIYPIPTVDKPTATLAEYMIAPPTVKRPPGRPKWKRIPSKGEIVQCIRCGKLGNHNKKTCKEPM